MSGLVLAALVATAAVSRGRGLVAQALLAVVSVLWLVLMDQRMEGQVLFTVLPTAGLTEGDLAGLTGLAIAAWRSVRLLRERP